MKFELTLECPVTFIICGSTNIFLVSVAIAEERWLVTLNFIVSTKILSTEIFVHSEKVFILNDILLYPMQFWKFVLTVKTACLLLWVFLFFSLTLEAIFKNRFSLTLFFISNLLPRAFASLCGNFEKRLFSILPVNLLSYYSTFTKWSISHFAASLSLTFPHHNNPSVLKTSEFIFLYFWNPWNRYLSGPLSNRVATKQYRNSFPVPYRLSKNSSKFQFKYIFLYRGTIMTRSTIMLEDYMSGHC